MSRCPSLKVSLGKAALVLACFVGSVHCSSRSSPSSHAIDWTITEPGESLWMSGYGITLGPDGNVWYLMVSQAGRGFLNGMTPAGKVKSSIFSTTTPMLGTIATGPDGNIWFAEKYADIVNGPDKVYVTTTSGVVTTVALPEPMSIESLIAGPDGNLWFTRWGGGDAGQPLERLTVAGVLTPFPVQAPVNPYRVAVGPDGNLWFTEFYRAAVGRMTLAGVVDEFPLVSSTAYGEDLVAGPDGNLWITQITPPALVRMTPAGVATEIALTARPGGITVGSDNALWFIHGSSIARYVPP
jgi:streptogramin lyase